MSGLHVAVIMDGNGRWAQERGMPRWRGHIAGLDSVREIVRAAPAMGVETLTLYAFSSDNWKRPAGEIRKLFWLLREYSRKERDELVERGVRVTMIGRRDRLPTGSRFAIERLEKITQNGTTLNLRLAIDYSARSEITRAIREAVEQGTSLTTEEIGRFLTRGVHDPDLLIRTAGERRLSDFLLWESAYTEFFFTPVAWPDFRPHHLEAALADFEGRERRFGGIISLNPRALPAVGELTEKAEKVV